MKQPNTTVLNLHIHGFVDSREVVNKLNEFYNSVGVVISQRAKYEKPSWFYILAILSDSEYGNGLLTINDIVCLLKEHNLKISYQSVRRYLKIMMNTKAAIHPHRRNCGISCHEFVKGFGGIARVIGTGIDSCSDFGRPPDAYRLGFSKVGVEYFKRAYNVNIEPCPTRNDENVKPIRKIVETVSRN